MQGKIAPDLCMERPLVSESYYYNSPAPQPAMERVSIGEDKTTRLHDRFGEYLELSPFQLMDLVNFALQNQQFIKMNRDERFTLPLQDAYGNDIRLFGDEIDAIMRKLASRPPEPQDFSSTYNF